MDELYPAPVVGCGSACGFKPTKKEAIEAWNRRAYEKDSTGKT